MADKQRIEYIDLIKGITIVLVMYYHCPVPDDNHAMLMLGYTRIPTYVFLSGLFFSTYDSFKQFAIKKTNRYLIPLLFFIMLAFATLPLHHDGLNFGEFKDLIYDVVVKCSVLNFNEPTWFLKMLIWLSLISYALSSLLSRQSKAIKIIACIVISYVAFRINSTISLLGYKAAYQGIYTLYGTQLPSALILLPFFFIPHILRNEILCPHKASHICMCLPIALLVLYLYANYTPWYAFCDYHSNYPNFFIGQFAGIYSIFAIGYLIKRIPLFSYLGRYSIILLGTHILVERTCQIHLHISNPYLMFVILVATAPPIICLLKRYFPHFTAQKDLLKLSPDGKLKISFKD